MASHGEDGQPARQPVKIEVIQAGVNPDRAKDGFPADPARTHEQQTGPAAQRTAPSRWRAAPPTGDLRLFHLHQRSAVARLRRPAQRRRPGLRRVRPRGPGMDVVRRIHWPRRSTTRTNTDAQRLTPPIKILTCHPPVAAPLPMTRDRPAFKPPDTAGKPPIAASRPSPPASSPPSSRPSTRRLLLALRASRARERFRASASILPNWPGPSRRTRAPGPNSSAPAGRLAGWCGRSAAHCPGPLVDLDRDGLADIVCDAAANRVSWIRQSPRGHLPRRRSPKSLVRPTRRRWISTTTATSICSSRALA